MRPAVSSRRRARNTVSDRFCKSNASSSASAGVLTDPASHPDELPILFAVHLARGRSGARHSPYGTLFSSMTDTLTPTRDDFAALLDEQLSGRDFGEGQVVHGRVVGIEKDIVIIDVGLKTEGRIAMREFGQGEDGALPKVGDNVEVYLERVENALGEAVISRDKARREEAWTRLEAVFAEGHPVNGAIVGRVKGGFTVDLGGASAFLPGSQVDIRPVRDVGPLMGKEQPFQILKMDRPRGNIVVSRRAILEEARAEQRTELVGQLQEGEVRDGVVKNITDYGAFVELEAGVEGLVHVSEMSWTKKNVHPGKIVSTSQEVDVVVLDVDASKRRISLGLKQAQDNPWDAFVANHPIGSTVEGEVKNATEFGLFIGLDNDIDGMVHLSDLDWSVSGEEAIQRYRKGEMVKAKVLDVDVEKERVSLGIKQLGGDPIGEGDAYRRGQQITVTVTAIESGGIEVKFGEDDAPVTAFIRKSDLSRDRNEQRPERFAVGDRADAMITAVDKASRRISVSIKALEMKDEQEAIEQFGSSDSGASLGDILGAALKNAGSKE